MFDQNICLMKRTHQFSIVFILSMLLFSSCARIIQGEVGVKRRFGKVGKKVIPPGLVVFNPFFTRVIKVPIRTVNLEISTGLPSKEGLTIKSEISILYRIKSKDAIDVLENIGLDFEEVIILPVFRSASADVCARFMAKDMHSAERSKIEREIRDQMTTTLEARGFIIEAVLMKNITLPAGLSKAIEDKLQAEQDALRMEFILQRESKDAERRVIEAEGQKQISIIQAEAQKQSQTIMAEGAKAARVIEAQGIKEANELMNSSLTPTVLKYKSIEAYRELVGSNNAKVIISDGKTPILGLPD
jgi:regulator of protease activity HflC (stomatin/prohibitin superfamily)